MPTKEDLLLDIEEESDDPRDQSNDGGGEGGDGYFEYA